MSISVVIRCLNEERYIGRLLDSIFAQSIESSEIIIVDSGSTDKTIEIASGYNTKILSIKPEDFSFGKSLNIGCAASNGDIIVIASAHVWPRQIDWIENLVKPFSDPNVALTYGKQRGDAFTKFSEHQILKKWFPERSDHIQAGPFCNNANSSIRRDLWESVPYDEDLTGLEDIEWAKRVISMGYSVKYSAEAEVIHSHNESSNQICNRYRREAIALKRIFPEERFNFYDFLKLYFSNTVKDMYSAKTQNVLSKNIIGIIVFRLMQFWGTFRGFHQTKSVTSDIKKKFYYPNS